MKDLNAGRWTTVNTASKQLKMLPSRKLNVLSCPREVERFVAYSVNVRARSAYGIFVWHDAGTNAA